MKSKKSLSPSPLSSSSSPTFSSASARSTTSSSSSRLSSSSSSLARASYSSQLSSSSSARASNSPSSSRSFPRRRRRCRRRNKIKKGDSKGKNKIEEGIRSATASSSHSSSPKRRNYKCKKKIKTHIGKKKSKTQGKGKASTKTLNSNSKGKGKASIVMPVDWVRFKEIGNRTLKHLIDNGTHRLMQPGITVDVGHDVKVNRVFQKPSGFLCSLIKAILRAYLELSEKKRPFKGDLRDIDSYGLFLVGDRLDVVETVFLLEELKEGINRGSDLEAELRKDRQGVVSLIKSLMEVTENNARLPFGSRQFIRRLDEFVDDPSQGALLSLINHYSLTAWHPRLFKSASLSAYYKTNNSKLDYNLMLGWQRAIPRHGLLKMFFDWEKYEDDSSDFMRYLRNIFSHSLEWDHERYRLECPALGSSKTDQHNEVLEVLLMEIFKEDLEYLINLEL